MDKSLYGRKWQLKVLCNDGTLFTVGSDGFSPESLRCTFDINYPKMSAWYFSEFTIYNPNDETQKKIIQEGAQVFFSAGYANGKYGQIFGGCVFQSLFDRENVTDYKLTLRCMDGYRLFDNNLTNFTMKEYTEMTLFNAMAAKSKTYIPVNHISPDIKQQAFPRARTVFCAPSELAREIARNNAAEVYVVNGKANLVTYTDSQQGEVLEVNPSAGLIGTPQQIDYGVSFRSLLNPDLILDFPPRIVHLDLSGISVKQQAATPGNENLVPLLTKDGYLQIGGVHHFGDTRGNEWYTDIIGYSLTGKMGLQLSTADAGSKPVMLKDPT